MKTSYIKLSILSLSLAGIVTSCDMDAPTQSSLDGSSVFSIYSLAEAEVMSIHQSFGETNSYRGRFLPFYGVDTDVEWINGIIKSKETDQKYSLGNYNTLSNNSQMNTENNAYAKFYEGIERANLAIQGIRQYGNIESNKDMAQLLGEALTLRAVIYNDLIKAWGDVPARFEPNNSDNMYKPRCNRDSIYKVLLADLKEAEDYCYWPNENTITSTTERVSKTFVKALRARIALYAGGYGLRGDGYRLSKDADLAPAKMYQIAKEECLDIINSNRNSLGSFKENFTKLCQDNVTAGGESIWEIPFSDGRGRVLYTWGVKHNADKKDQYTEQMQGGVNGPLPTLFYDYDKDDVRRNITCVPYEWGKNDESGNSKQELRSIDKWCFGKLRYEWMKRIVTSTNDDGVNFQYMRLADVYLMAAEAINQLDNDQAAAWTYMAPVLNRALPSDKVAALKTKYTASQSAFQDGIIDQRALEFAGEQLRKADLVRWGNIDPKMAEAKTKLQNMSDRKGAYADLPNKLYYKTLQESDIDASGKAKDEGNVFDTPKAGETILVYGMEHGDTDEAGKALGYDNLTNGGSKSWFTTTKTDDKTGVTTTTNNLSDDSVKGLYTVTPSTHCLWPIWDTFVSSSNGMLDTFDLLSD